MDYGWFFFDFCWFFSLKIVLIHRFFVVLTVKAKSQRCHFLYTQLGKFAYSKGLFGVVLPFSAALFGPSGLQSKVASILRLT